MAEEKRLHYEDVLLTGIKTLKECHVAGEKELTPEIVEAACRALTMVEHFIKKLPTVNAVEVVRCRECANTCPGTIGLVCTMWGNRTAPDGFCYMGERKE